MKAHKGMRPQDIVVLLKIIAEGDAPWQNKDIANSLFMSQSEITESLNRSQFAGLLDPSRKTVFINSLFDFLVFGLRFVFPAQPGALVRGIPTAHSAPVLKDYFKSDEKFVWPHPEGTVRGQAVEPLYATVPLAVSKDEKLHHLLALADAFRIGRTREIKMAKDLFLKIAKTSKSAGSN